MLETGEDISEQIINIKKQFLYFSKFYSKLINTGATGFMYMDKETQDMVLHDVYVNNSKLEYLLRDIHENELNGDNLRKIFGARMSSDDSDNDDEGCDCDGEGKTLST